MHYLTGRTQVTLIFLLLLYSHALAGEILRIASTSSRASDEIKKFLPVATYLAKALATEGITEGQVVVARSLRETAKLLHDGKADLYMDSPFPSMVVSHLSGSKLLLRRWKKGVAEYRSLIFVKNDSGILRLENLIQKTLGFETSYSTSAYFLPKIILLHKGFKLKPMDYPGAPVAPGETGYLFTGDDENTLAWVLKGKVDAGATDDQTYFNEAGREFSNFHVVYKSFPIPRHLVSHRGNLGSRLVAKIKDVLKKMDQSETGKKALHDFENTAKFDEIPAGSMAPILAGWKFVEAEVMK
jgi:ABC-type phosphate/phosphonate transport system substrate-binding protein